MRENTLKQRLYAGKAAFGDWILLDNEHGSITVDTAEACIAAAELIGIAPIVRPVGKSRRSSPRSWIAAPGA
jgi:2-keto-3-deoxy-L-rhamnonate aldolase RhmA